MSLELNQDQAKVAATFLENLVKAGVKEVDVYTEFPMIVFTGRTLDRVYNASLLLNVGQFNTTIETKINTSVLASLFKQTKNFDTITLDFGSSELKVKLTAIDRLNHSAIPLLGALDIHKPINMKKVVNANDRFAFNTLPINLINVCNIAKDFVGSTDDSITIAKINQSIKFTSKLDAYENESLLEGDAIDAIEGPDASINLFYSFLVNALKNLKSDSLATFFVPLKSALIIQQFVGNDEIRIGIGGKINDPDEFEEDE